MTILLSLVERSHATLWLSLAAVVVVGGKMLAVVVEQVDLEFLLLNH
jgi:hypothetical protein